MVQILIRESRTGMSRMERGNEDRNLRWKSVAMLWLERRTTCDKNNFIIEIPIVAFHLYCIICWSSLWLHSTFWLRPIALECTSILEIGYLNGSSKRKMPSFCFFLQHYLNTRFQIESHATSSSSICWSPRKWPLRRTSIRAMQHLHCKKKKQEVILRMSKMIWHRRLDLENYLKRNFS